MEPLFIYFLKTILCSGVMFSYYLIFLKDKTFHHYNRFYLLGTVAISLALPLLKVSYFTMELNPKIVLLLEKLNYSTEKNTNDDFYFQIGFAVLGFTSLLFLIKFLMGIIKIQQFKKIYPKESSNGISFYSTDLENAPFSFFKNLFWKKSILPQSDLGKQILKHEMVHIEQKHSLDKILMEVLKSIFWFNPFFWLIKKEIHLIHEYLADKKALKNSDTKAFAQMLLASHFSGNILPATNPFLNSNLKKRLQMIQKSKTKLGYLRKILALPLLFAIGFIYLVNAKNKEIETTNKILKNMFTQLDKNYSDKSTSKDTLNNNLVSDDIFVFEGKEVSEEYFNEMKNKYGKNAEYYFTSSKNYVDENFPVIFSGGKKENERKIDEKIGKIVEKVWDSEPLTFKLPKKDKLSIDEKLEKATDKNLFIINSEKVSKEKFIEYYKKNRDNSAIIFSDATVNDQDHWVFGEFEREGVFTIHEFDFSSNVKHDASKFHKLIKEINPRWYYEQIINNKYGKIQAEKRKKANQDIETVNAIIEKENPKEEDMIKTSSNPVPKDVISITANKIRIENPDEEKDLKQNDYKNLPTNFYLDGNKITREELEKYDIQKLDSVKIIYDNMNDKKVRVFQLFSKK